jgi:hypothetical protein
MKHYHFTVSVGEDGYEALKIVSEILNSPDFKGLTISIEPDDIMPDAVHHALTEFFQSTLIMIKDLNINARYDFH